MSNMFCVQCKHVSGKNGCTVKAGVCGKQSDKADFLDKLTGVFIRLAI